MKKDFILIFSAVVILTLGFGVWYFGSQNQGTSLSGVVACTQEAMQCPDGSFVGRTAPHCAFAPCSASSSPSTISIADTSDWKTYSSVEFGFSFTYPTTWQKSGDVLSAANPHIFFGNPLNGTTTYVVKIFVLKNPQNFSAADFVKQILADDAAQDASNSAQGPAPRVTPQFMKQYSVPVGRYPGYELFNVFEFDHQAEQVYIQQNKQIVIFDFPMADVNPNIANAAGNNAIAHQIMSTLKLDPAVWKFCGGIAAGKFPCATGYSCKLDGSYPDAGGHCVKNLK